MPPMHTSYELPDCRGERVCECEQRDRRKASQARRSNASRPAGPLSLRADAPNCLPVGKMPIPCSSRSSSRTTRFSTTLGASAPRWTACRHVSTVSGRVFSLSSSSRTSTTRRSSSSLASVIEGSCARRVIVRLTCLRESERMQVESMFDRAARREDKTDRAKREHDARDAVLSLYADHALSCTWARSHSWGMRAQVYPGHGLSKPRVRQN